MNIKVCDVKIKEQLVLLDRMGVDYAGLVFHNARDKKLQTNITAEEILELGLDMQIVGRFRFGSLDDILDIIEQYHLNMIQIDHQLSVQECGILSEHVELIKTIPLAQRETEKTNDLIREYDGVCDYYCFDSILGQSFPWNMLDDLEIEKPFFTGGSWLRPSDATVLHRFFHPDFYGVDLQEPFEKAPGDKDTALILSFIRSVNQIDN